ncbi:cysteine hydrolase family protein [Ramlibacter algicola]|uniref:Isochorismatase family protein n=1 Tax=Ramlibacter algicola TaxID=2795217 RepID=A0A934Q085_9BURK|nr:isochorismatase family protein [Ramlibacter algicola]MBK0392328.1 isochorismatase family protein [Ramlibacter algicola]
MATIRSGQQPALLVIDAQQGVIGDAWDAQRIIGNINVALDRARTAGVPVIWIQQEDEHEYPRGSDPWKLVPDLRPREGELRMSKAHNSAFEHTPLEQELAQMGVSHLVVCGASTNWCVRSTAYAGLERGYDVTLLKDAHTTNAIDLGDGTEIDARGIVIDLNVTMSWSTYPGRKCATATAAEVEFSTER